jgi:hypothetical protein
LAESTVRWRIDRLNSVRRPGDRARARIFLGDAPWRLAKSRVK